MLLKGRFISYTMTEASDSFFSYRPVLDALKSMISIPLAQDIVHLRPTKERPSYLCRNISGVLHDTSKPKFTRPETVKPC